MRVGEITDPPPTAKGDGEGRRRDSAIHDYIRRLVPTPDYYRHALFHPVNETANPSAAEACDTRGDNHFDGRWNDWAWEWAWEDNKQTVKNNEANKQTLKSDNNR